MSLVIEKLRISKQQGAVAAEMRLKFRINEISY